MNAQNTKVAGRLGGGALAAAILLAGSALTIATAGPAAADEDTAIAKSSTAISSDPGGGYWLGMLKTGQSAWITPSCDPGVAGRGVVLYCQIWNANLGLPNGTGWVKASDLKRK